MMRLEQVSVVLGGHPVLRDVSLALAPGELVAVVGPNGAGKSTLLGVASGERVPRRGRVTLDGEPLTSLAPERWARRHAVVAQRARLDAALRVHEVVALGRWPHRVLQAKRERAAAPGET